MNLARLEQSLTVDEGKELTPYRDSLGLWTTGIGRCLESNPITGPEWKWLLDHNAVAFRLADEGAKYLFDDDVLTAVRQIKARCDFWDRLDDVRQNVLIEMCFQLGIQRLLGFNKMFAALRVGNWAEAKKEALDSDWSKQTPKRAEMLAERLLTGVW